MDYKIAHKPLYVFVLYGFLLWFLVYAMAPAQPTYGLSYTAFLFIAGSIACYFAGYFLCKKFYNTKVQEETTQIQPSFIWFLIGFLYVSWAIRFVDIFINRGISFSNTIQENRNLLGVDYLNPIYILATIFKELYFLPLLLVLIKFRKHKTLLVLSSVLFTFPLLMPFLAGTRKDAFLTGFVLVIVLIISKVMVLSLKTILKMGIGFIILNIIFFNILMARETPKYNKDKDPIIELVDGALYNDLFAPTETIKATIKSSTGVQKEALFYYLHSTQYYCHGIFEFDYLLKEKIKNKNYLYGVYNFYLVPKLFEKLNIIDYDLNKIQEHIPRKITYITFFGSLFVDFGWFGVAFMFLLGCFQNIIDKKITSGNVLYLSLYVFFVIFNLFIPVIDMLRGTGFYLLVASIIVVLAFKILIKTKTQREI